MANDAITTAAQNIAIAINTITSTLKNIYGSITTIPLTAGTHQIYTGGGRLVNVSVTTAAAVNATFYDVAQSNNAATTNILVVQDCTNLETTSLNKPFANGLTVTVGAGAVITVTYSIT
jgi:hypothetical protein